MNVIYIDTADNTKIIVKLKTDAKEFVKERKIEVRSSQLVLRLIDELLKENNFKPKNLTGIEVNTGPGSFTGIRVGISIANALSFSLGIPVNGNKIENGQTPVDPRY